LGTSGKPRRPNTRFDKGRGSRRPSSTGRRIGAGPDARAWTCERPRTRHQSPGSRRASRPVSRVPLEPEKTGISYQRLASNLRNPFGYKHTAEGGLHARRARVILEDEVVQLSRGSRCACRENQTWLRSRTGQGRDHRLRRNRDRETRRRGDLADGPTPRSVGRHRKSAPKSRGRAMLDRGWRR
jgi:hypothetical protein